MNPKRCCLKIIGPGDVIFIIMDTIIKIGEKKSNADIDIKISNSLLRKCLYKITLHI